MCKCSYSPWHRRGAAHSERALALRKHGEDLHFAEGFVARKRWFGGWSCNWKYWKMWCSKRKVTWGGGEVKWLEEIHATYCNVAVTYHPLAQGPFLQWETKNFITFLSLDKSTQRYPPTKTVVRSGCIFYGIHTKVIITYMDLDSHYCAVHKKM